MEAGRECPKGLDKSERASADRGSENGGWKGAPQEADSWEVREKSICVQSANRGLENGGWKGAPQEAGRLEKIMSACDQSADRGSENGGWKGVPQVGGHGRLEKFSRQREREV